MSRRLSLFVLLTLITFTHGNETLAQNKEGDPYARIASGLLEIVKNIDRERMQSDPSYRHWMDGKKLFRDGKFPEASFQFGEALRTADGNDSVNMIRAEYGYALVLSQQPRKALAMLDQSIADSIGMGGLAWVQMAKGMAHAMLGEIQPAFTALTASIDKAPSAMALRFRGLLYFRQRRLELALDDFREIQRLHPELEQARDAVVLLEELIASRGYLASLAAEANAELSPSGLIYIEQAAGTGASPVATDTVRVRYRGTLRDGSVFDSSSAFRSRLDRVIPCWTEGVQKMKVGGKARLGCPASIAYGERGAPPRIPGGAALTFDVELLAIE